MSRPTPGRLCKGEEPRRRSRTLQAALALVVLAAPAATATSAYAVETVPVLPETRCDVAASTSGTSVRVGTVEKDLTTARDDGTGSPVHRRQRRVYSDLDLRWAADDTARFYINSSPIPTVGSYSTLTPLHWVGPLNAGTNNLRVEVVDSGLVASGLLVEGGARVCYDRTVKAVTDSITTIS